MQKSDKSEVRGGEEEEEVEEEEEGASSASFCPALTCCCRFEVGFLSKDEWAAASSLSPRKWGKMGWWGGGVCFVLIMQTPR